MYILQKAVNGLPNRKNVQPTKVKNLSFSRDDFGKRGKKVISNNTKKNNLTLLLTLI